MQNIENVKQSNPKDAIGCTKPGLSVIPWGAMRAAGIKREDFHPAAFYWFAAAMLDGACKYGRHNYRAIGVRASIYYDATNRHSDAILAGELIDPDSGLPHLLKMVSSLSVLVDAMESGKWYDDRPPRQRSHQMFNDDMCAIDMLDCWWEGADMVFLHRALFKMFSAFHDDYCAEHRDSLLHPMAWMTEVQAKVKEILAKYPDPKEPFTEVGMRMREAQLEADRALDVPDVGTLYGQARGGGKSVFGKGIDVPDVDAETVPASQPLTREEFAQAFTAPAGTPWHTPPTDDGITICINCGSAVDYYRGIKTDNHMAVLSCHCGLLKRERPLTEIGAS